MDSRRRRRSDRTLRPPLRSPGRPPGWRREHLQQFWEAIARGLSSEEAGIVAGLSPAVGGRLFRQGGGMRTISRAPLSGRYLSFAEREEIALLNARGCGVREIASQVCRSPSTISRELRRNAATRSGSLEYRDQCPVACRSPCQAAQGHEACCQRCAARIRPRVPRWYGHNAKWDGDPRPRRSLGRAPAWPAERPTVGHVVEPGADLKPPPIELPR